MSKKRTPIALVVIDGWGHSTEREGNALALAETPFYDAIREKYPRTLLEASGERVGLPAGVMGNSEVGHLNLGSGRVIRMDVSRIDHGIRTGDFFENEALTKAMDAAQERAKAVHLMGLLSDGQVHSSQEHLYALLRMAKLRGVEKVFIHCFMDGRDAAPRSGAVYLEMLQAKIAEIGVGEVATLCGRYYAMDRDKRWERTARAFTLLVHGEGISAFDPVEAMRNSYERGITDEFADPVVIEREPGVPVGLIENGDAVIFFNFRADRARQITRALAIKDFDEPFAATKPNVDFVCMREYDKDYPLQIAFPPQHHTNVLAQVFAHSEINNFRLAETEKYAHVTYFFNGGVEQEYNCESRLLVPSQKVATYDLAPEMSAFKITDKFLRAVEEGETDVFIVNYANPDMVGHTGNIRATIEAVQHIDTCIGWITKGIRAAGGTCLITSDHGNCEQMIDLKTGEPHTAHTTNLVPFHLVNEDYLGAKLREDAALEDVAPTLLAMLGLEKPLEMTGRDLRES